MLKWLVPTCWVSIEVFQQRAFPGDQAGGSTAAREMFEAFAAMAQREAEESAAQRNFFVQDVKATSGMGRIERGLLWAAEK